MRSSCHYHAVIGRESEHSPNMAGARTTCLIWQVPVGGTQFTYTGMPVRLVAPVHRWCALLLSKLPLITIKTSADYHQNFRRLPSKLPPMAAETRADYYAFTAPRRCRTPLLLRDYHLGEYLGDMCRRYMLDRPLNERRAGSKWILVYTRSCLEYGMS